MRGIVLVALTASLMLAAPAKAKTWERTVARVWVMGELRVYTEPRGKPIIHHFVREGNFFRRPGGPTIYEIK